MCGDLLQVPPAHGTAALAAVQQECLSVLVHSSPGMPGCCDGLGLYVHGSLCLQHSHKSSSTGFLREQVLPTRCSDDWEQMCTSQVFTPLL